VRDYGNSGPLVAVLHGGPGAAGGMAPVARELAESFQVLEPFQRRSGDVPLTVADHVADLRGLVTSRCAGTPPALVGHSWGAMLALAFAAAHPDLTGPLVLVGCGTFDPMARARLHAIVEERMTPPLRRRLELLPAEIPDPDELMRAQSGLTLPLYSHDLIASEPEPIECDARAHEETWADMLRLQERGVYPSAFAAIRSPVLMLHGAADPHPGRMILESLRPHIPQIEYCELEQCGHYPWLEKAARGQFFATLKTWLSAREKER
jgi:pimeloyl-ACP methyl ester carboxylesterase